MPSHGEPGHVCGAGCNHSHHRRTFDLRTNFSPEQKPKDGDKTDLAAGKKIVLPNLQIRNEEKPQSESPVIRPDAGNVNAKLLEKEFTKTACAGHVNEQDQGTELRNLTRNLSQDTAMIAPALHNFNHLRLTNNSLPVIPEFLKATYGVIAVVAAGELPLEGIALGPMNYRIAAIHRLRGSSEKLTATDYEEITATWDAILQTKNPEFIGTSLANILEILKTSDALRPEDNQHQIFDDFAEHQIFNNPKAKAFLECREPSPVRLWLADAHYSAYHPSLRNMYQYMFAFGSALEVDKGLKVMEAYSFYCEQDPGFKKLFGAPASSYHKALEYVAGGKNSFLRPEELNNAPIYEFQNIKFPSLIAKVNTLLGRLNF